MSYNVSAHLDPAPQRLPMIGQNKNTSGRFGVPVDTIDTRRSFGDFVRRAGLKTPPDLH